MAGPDDDTPEQTMEQGFKSDTERVFLAREKFAEAAVWRKEEDGFKAKQKDARERAEGFEAEGISIIMDKPSAQVPLALVTPTEQELLQVCHADSAVARKHEFTRIRDAGPDSEIPDQVILEACELCDVERTAKAPSSPEYEPAWVYYHAGHPEPAPTGADA